jgi:hypothetical protein
VGNGFGGVFLPAIQVVNHHFLNVDSCFVISGNTLKFQGKFLYSLGKLLRTLQF